VSDLEDRLREVVGPRHVLTDPDLRAPYETDWTRRFSGEARCVVRPASTAEVSAVVRACAEAGVAITVQGGNTGLVGAAVPAGGEVLLSLGRLTDLEDVDVLEGQVTAGAGVTLEKLQQHARPHGLDVGVDLAARSAATVGGLVATNAGGLRVVRYGSMREQLTGIEAVLADGSVVSRLVGLAKDNTGYDLTQLLAGSEGTLAVITKVRLRLVPRLPARAVALVAVDGVAGALEVLAAARAGLASLSAAELFLAEGLELVRAHGRLAAPFAESHPAYVTLECAARTDPTDELLEVLGECEAVRDATVASDVTGVTRLWAYRETHTEAISAAGVPVKLDVSVPLRELAGLVADLPGTVAAAAPGARVFIFGHLGEGNLHVNVLDAGEHAEQVSDAVLRLVAERRGSISSEHGVGRAKARWLTLSRSATEIAAMRRIKAALDPAGTLNPGVLLG
jgi:FAD/FMN-containing dehydrogenase